MPEFEATINMRVTGWRHIYADSRHDADEEAWSTNLDEITVTSDGVLDVRLKSLDPPKPVKLTPTKSNELLTAFPEPEPSPKTVTVHWSCGMAIGAPRWMGTEAYECPECPGEGAFVVAEEEVSFDGEQYCGPHTSCTLCHQDLEDPSHYWIDEKKRKERLKTAAGY